MKKVPLSYSVQIIKLVQLNIIIFYMMSPELLILLINGFGCY